MVEHYASVTVKAPVHQVYELFTHFDDFPKFMSFVKEVTYHDERRSHWVVQVVRQYEWDAVNEDWIADKQIGWRSTSGLNNAGRVKFSALGPNRTIVDVYIRYIPPSGPLGELGQNFGVSSYFDMVLQKDLSNFARMVEEAPAGALDPMSSHYLFHKESAVARGRLTSRQKEAMALDPRMSPQALAERQARIEQEDALRRQAEQEREEARQRQAEQQRQAEREQRERLASEAARRRLEQRAREAAILNSASIQPATEYDPLQWSATYAWLAHGLGDKDGLRARVPNYTQDPMTSRRPVKSQGDVAPPAPE